MGSVFTIIVSEPDSLLARAAAYKAFARIDEINLALSDYSEASETWQMNAATPEGWVPISPDLSKALTMSQRLSEQTFGTFDPTIGQLVQLWRRARRKNEVPPRQQINEALLLKGFDALELDTSQLPHKIRYLKQGVQLDFGGIGKGYAADEALRVLTEAGFPKSFVSASSSIAVGDAPDDRPEWTFMMENREKEDADKNGIEQVIECTNCFIASSGDLYQYLEVNGRRYSHIIDPETGEALSNGSFAIVLAPSAALADAYATAFCVMEMEDVRRFLEANTDISAMVWKKNGEILEELALGVYFGASNKKP
jgi:thiamine biosynthesis lipoprotein